MAILRFDTFDLVDVNELSTSLRQSPSSSLPEKGRLKVKFLILKIYKKSLWTAEA